MDKYNQLLKTLKEIESTSFTDTFINFQRLMEHSFIKQMDVISESKYRINPSTGMGRLAKIWWCGIFDIDFYNKAYQISDKRKISARLGYYIVYLLNEDRTKLYLSINQASRNISLQKNKGAMLKMIETNNYLRKYISLKPNYLTNIHGKLSNNSLHQARDYEIASIIAIEYDLLNFDTTDLQYKVDLINIINDFNIIKNILLELYVETDDYNFYTEDSQTNSPKIKILSSNNQIHYLSDEERNKLNNREVKYTYANNDKENPKAIRNKDLVEDVIKNANYRCTINQKHKTFMGKNNHLYVEVHHLIPMKFQYLFGNFNLDCTDNMICVCPTCHAAIHHGTIDIQKRILKPLFDASPMKKILKNYGFACNFDEFLEKFYN